MTTRLQASLYLLLVWSALDLLKDRCKAFLRLICFEQWVSSGFRRDTTRLRASLYLLLVWSALGIDAKHFYISYGLNNGFSDPWKVLASFQCDLRKSSFHNVHEGRVPVCPTYIDIIMSMDSVPIHVHNNRVSQLKVSKPNFSGLPLRRFIKSKRN